MTSFNSNGTMTKCPRCNGALYNRVNWNYANCINCGYEPQYISEDVAAEVAEAKGLKRLSVDGRESKYARRI